MRDRLGVGRRRRIDGAFEPAPHQAVVGEVLLDAEALGLEAGPRRDHVHALGPHPLQLGEQVRVERELQDGPGPRLPG